MADQAYRLPLTETMLLILLSVAKEARHGYAIIKDVEQLSEKRVLLSAGTLYGAIKRMVADGWIQRVNDAGGTVRPGLPRKTYRISKKGRVILNAEIKRLQNVLSAIRARVNEGKA